MPRRSSRSAAFLSAGTVKNAMADFKVEMTLVHPKDGSSGVVELTVHPEWAPLGAKCAAPRRARPRIASEKNCH